MWALVVHDERNKLVVYVFHKRADATDYVDEFGGNWQSWNLLQTTPATY